MGMAFEEEPVGKEDIDFGNHVVSPNGPTDPKPVLKYPPRDVSERIPEAHGDSLAVLQGLPILSNG